MAERQWDNTDTKNAPTKNVDAIVTGTITGPLTDTQLRATPVPVSGTVTATGGLTDTQLRATPVPVSAANLDVRDLTFAADKVDASGSSVKFIDEVGVAYGVKQIDGKPRVSATPYGYDIAEGNIVDHNSWTKIGYTPVMTTVESDVWSKAGVYIFAAAAGKLEVVSSDNTQDIGTVIKGDATGNTIQSDIGGSTTTLVDADVDFLAATTVAVGDCVILDPHGTTPEWGYVTGVATHTLTLSGGFSSGGTGASRYYAIVDKSAYTHAQVVKVEYLTTVFAQKSEIVVLNGTTAVDTVNTDLYRVNSFRIIATGTSNVCKGNLTIQADGAGATYSYIIAGFTRARSLIYTVPAGKTLYVNSVSWGYGYSANQTHYTRLYTRANREPSTNFLTGSLFYAYTETICANTTDERKFEVPTKLISGTDLKISGIATYSGIAVVQLKGWLE